jgi:predicted membrane protein
MEILFSRVFWGIFIIIIGLSFILTTVWNIKLPIFRILISLLIIYVGVSLLIGAFSGKSSKSWNSDTTQFFHSAAFAPDDETLSKEYTTVFGSQTINLSKLDPKRDYNLETNSIFGSTRVVVPAHFNLRVKASTAFGSVSLPDGGSAVLGDNTFVHKGNPDSAYTLFIEGNAVFGSFQLLLK